MKTVNANETVWITGSSGFLGSRLSHHFASSGNRVVGLSRRGCATPHSLKIDLSSPDSIHTLRQLVAKGDGPTILIHAASKQPGSGSLQDFVSSNVQATRNLADALSDSPPKQLIYTSTQSVYHHPLTIPVREDAPAGGTLPYSATKRWGEQVLEFLADRTEVIVLRLPSLYGKGQADSFVDGLAKSAAVGERIELFSRGEVVRDALHVSDVVEAIATCVGQTHSAGYVLMNLGCGRAVKTIEYARAIIDALESTSEIVLSDRPASHESLYGDIDRARQKIGFQPKTLSESMKEYANELRT